MLASLLSANTLELGTVAWGLGNASASVGSHACS